MRRVCREERAYGREKESVDRSASAAARAMLRYCVATEAGMGNRCALQRRSKAKHNSNANVFAAPNHIRTQFSYNIIII